MRSYTSHGHREADVASDAIQAELYAEEQRRLSLPSATCMTSS